MLSLFNERVSFVWDRSVRKEHFENIMCLSVNYVVNMTTMQMDMKDLSLEKLTPGI